MQQKKLLVDLKSHLNKINDKLQLKIQEFSDEKTNMQQAFEDMQDSLEELREHINIIQKEVKNNDNIFYIGKSKNDQSNKLFQFRKQEQELTEKFEYFQHQLSKLDLNHQFFSDLKLDLSEVISEIESYEEDNEVKDWLAQLLFCQNLMEVDFRRSSMELNHLINKVKDSVKGENNDE